MNDIDHLVDRGLGIDPLATEIGRDSIHIVGYSTGAALAVEYALAGLLSDADVGEVRRVSRDLGLPVAVTAALLRRRDDGPAVYKKLRDELAGEVSGELLPAGEARSRDRSAAVALRASPRERRVDAAQRVGAPA